jgi:hypothetical protein
MQRKHAILEASDCGSPVVEFDEINQQLGRVGSRLWPLDLSSVPANIRALLAQKSLTEDDEGQIKEQFLFSQQRLLQIISDAGRQPNVSGGGEISTYDATHEYFYPQFWVVQDGIDYSRFDQYHVNVAPDGVGVDEVLQMLSGSGLKVYLRVSDSVDLKLTLSCPSDSQGWLLTYNGGRPHVGSVSSADVGSKLLVQVIGPPRWTMNYVD